MGKILKFEDLEIWQKARENCQYIEYLIQNTRLKVIFHLKIKLIEVQGLLWIILQKDLREMEIKSLYIF